MTNLTHNSFFYMFISVLYMFRATSCSPSGESILSIQHMVCVTLCRWPSITQVGKELPDLHTRRSEWHYQMFYWYNWFSWWWARGCSKHVENWSKYIEKRIVRQVGYLRELSVNDMYLFYILNRTFWLSGSLVIVSRQGTQIRSRFAWKPTHNSEM
jgi:hypothetical protein